jgi:hypothetical protein
MNQAGFAFDHAVLAVRDLADAMERFRRLGFDVVPGGRHPGFGTVNGLVQLGNGYIELLSVEDAAVAREAGIRRREVVEYLEQRDGGLIGYAIRCASLESVRLRGGGTGPGVAGPPLEMSRTRPDGSTLRWRLLVPGGSTWCRPWPFLIEWDPSPDPSTLSAATHANGASDVDALVVGTTSPPEVEAFYREQLGLDAQPLQTRGEGIRQPRAIDVGDCRIELVEVPQPGSPGPFRGTVNGEGVVELRIRVASLEAVKRLLATRGVLATSPGAHQLDVQPAAAAGARLAFVQSHGRPRIRSRRYRTP